MMRRFLLACAFAASIATGAAQARQAPVNVPAPVASVTASAVSVADAAPATAPAPMPSAVRQPSATGTAAGSLIQTILALSAVLGLLALLAWFMKRYGPKAAGGSAHVRLVGALNLGGRERIMVVEVGDQWIVVGASPGRVNALATMPRKESADAALPSNASLHPHQPSASSFAEWLKQTIDKRNAK
ncbi:MAG: fliO [Massilia sp.]|jgi:flagellar protein FliO/FliZ|nr:fliO [Massilia sp.]